MCDDISSYKEGPGTLLQLQEIGHAIICEEDAWFCATVVKSNIVGKLVPGGLAQTIGAMLISKFFQLMEQICILQLFM